MGIIFSHEQPSKLHKLRKVVQLITRRRMAYIVTRTTLQNRLRILDKKMLTHIQRDKTRRQSSRIQHRTNDEITEV
jgi:hypothetical protein